MTTAIEHPVQVSIATPEHPSRALALFSIPFFLARIIILIPAFFCIYFVSLVAGFAVWFGMWAVLFTGKYPQGLHDFGAGTVRWQTRIYAYYYGLTDAYPPFRLRP
jgi:hypothetical protein